MKKSRLFFTLAAAAALTIAPLTLGACEKKDDQASEKHMTYLQNPFFDIYRQADDYLRENGYSEEFISSTGKETKIALYGADAVFESEISAATDDREDWKGFSATLTVSTVTLPQSAASVKYLTYNWAWSEERKALDDMISVSFGSEVVSMSKYDLFEISGAGTLDNSYVPQNSTQTIAQEYDGTYLLTSGFYLPYSISQQTLSFQFSVDFGSMCRMLYPDVISPEGTISSANTPYGEYLIDAGNYRGSYTFALASQKSTPVLSSASVCYKQISDGAYAQSEQTSAVLKFES